MGIDAKLFVRIKDPAHHLPADQVLKTAVELSSTLGHKHFYIQDSNAHCLSIVQPYSEQDFEDDKGYLGHDVIGKTLLQQDGDPEVMEDGEQLLEVHLMQRYYGPGYARGHWPTIRDVMEWLEFKFPTGEIWFGGDSSGVLAEHFTKEKREEMTRFWLSSGTSTYGVWWDSLSTGGGGTPVCECCKIPLSGRGGGRDVGFWSCRGCGKAAVVFEGHTQWGSRWEDDFSHLAEKAREDRARLIAGMPPMEESQ